MSKKTIPAPGSPQEVLHLVQSARPTKEIGEKIQLLYAGYTELLQKRSALHEKIKESLVPKSEPFTFNNWWRLTTYKYSQDPLNASGSYKSPTGGRFNIGQIDATNSGKFAMFPVLYLAETKKYIRQMGNPKLDCLQWN